ncbi:PREDICTED: clusterin isoform X2 [Nanorana parkeri]|uniref:clusterin isoform X2 n=1 Tax=Nanorana parkeri TaxID=125878 RepID=UPI0008540AE8|nr:PREDICTED: clusterin isoform X2 [Nanorana parkeri]
MKMIPLSLLLVAVLLNFTGALLPPESLKKISEEGSKYITEQFENALNGVRQMKQLMDQTGEEHQKILRTLEETKKNKEDALKGALESEQQLSETKEICNDTMLALWEECKPCLKQTCVKFYSKTCRSGSGLVGRQLEDFLNRSSPFAIWVNGERIDILNKQDKQQHMTLEDLEDGYSIVEDSVHELFQDSVKAFDHMKPFFSRPFQGLSLPQWEPIPFQRINAPVSAMRIRKERSPLAEPFFTSNFDSLFEAAQKMMERHRQIFQQGPLFNGMSNSTDDKVVCRELRRNTAGCLKMKDKCEKCKEILAVDCSGKDVMQQKLREKFEDSVRLAEKYTKVYDEVLQKFREKMLNTTGILEDLSHQYNWVSKLANLTENDKNGIFHVSTAHSSSGGVPSNTTVTVKLFDSESFTFTVPGHITMEDPKFGELVAEEALKRFKKEVVEAV